MIELGQEVKDRVTGFKGIATAKTTYLQGCDRFSVTPPVSKSGDLQDTQSFDEPDLIVVSDGILPKVVKPQTPPGGPRYVPMDRTRR